jgi:transposase
MNEVGIDVSAAELSVAVRTKARRLPVKSFPNGEAGFKELHRWIRQGSRKVRVCLEATGIYGLALSLFLHKQKGVELMVTNPRTMKNFLKARGFRAKTDKIDAEGILEYLSFAEFRAWEPPGEEVLELQGHGRRFVQLTEERTRENNRLHKYEKEGRTGRFVAGEIRRRLKEIDQALVRLEKHAWELIEADAELVRAAEVMRSMSGMGPKTTVRLLAEILSMPKGLKAKQWVAMAGLDPRVFESGSSISKKRYISKQGNQHIRSALYMPALVAIRHDAKIKVFYEHLVAQGKRPKVAIVAIMRKMLVCLHAMLNGNKLYDPNLFYQPIPA